MGVKAGENSPLRATLKPLPGNLDLSSVPSGATVLVDGEKRGVTPLSVAVEALSRHSLVFSLAKHEGFTTEAKTGPNGKQRIEAKLSPFPGSISVSTTPPGVTVSLDNDVEFGETPCVFEKVSAGTHELSISDMLNGKIYYDGGGTVRVVVNPDEATKVDRKLAQGKGTFAVLDAPAGSRLSIDGKLIESPEVFTTGIEVATRMMDVNLVVPPYNEWKGTVTTRPREDIRYRKAGMDFVIPNKTIKVDGKVDDWAGIEPVYISTSDVDFFPNQPGTKVARCYLCRDARNLYWRYDFLDGSPSPKLTADFPIAMVYTLRAFVDSPKLVAFDIRFEKNGNAGSWVGVYNTSTRKANDLVDQNGVSYRIGDSCLEASVALSLISKEIGTTPRSFEFTVAKTDAKGGWLSNWTSGMLRSILTK